VAALFALAGAIGGNISQRETERKLKELNATLDQKVQERTSQLAEKTENIRLIFKTIKQGLFTVTRNLAIEEDFSAQLPQVLPSVGRGERSILRALQRDCGATAEEIKDLESFLVASFDTPKDFGFLANAELLPRKCSTVDTSTGKKKYFEFDWDALEDAGELVCKVIVAVRDVTELTELRETQELERIESVKLGEIVGLGAVRSASFFESAIRYLNDCRLTMSSLMNGNGTNTDLNVLQRSLHTLKGNARVYGLSLISPEVHALEDALLIAGKLRTRDPELLVLFDSVVRCVESYRAMFESLCVFSAESQMKERSGPTLHDLIEIHGRALAKLAMAEGQNKPSFVTEGIDPRLVSFDDAALRVMDGAFAHILTNSYVHGIEPVEERRKIGKPEAGSIHFGLFARDLDHSTSLVIEVSDDGRGLALQKLRGKIGIKSSQPSTDRDTAEIIFGAGVSTVEEVTTLAGRGMGLSAVREMCNNIGATISLALVGGKDGDAYRPFRFVIQIPPHLWQLKASLVSDVA
jgi:two-component system chemotaxis sensor kinase CheA